MIPYNVSVVQGGNSSFFTVSTGNGASTRKKKQAVGIDLLVENSSEREMLFPVESKKRRKT